MEKSKKALKTKDFFNFIFIKKIEEYFSGRVGKTELGKPRLVLFAYCLQNGRSCS